MRSLDTTMNLGDLLQNHYNPALAEQKIQEVHDLFQDSTNTLLSKAERRAKGWDEAYDLRPWQEFPDTDRLTSTSIVLQNLTMGYLGAGGGPSKESVHLGDQIRSTILG